MKNQQINSSEVMAGSLINAKLAPVELAPVDDCHLYLGSVCKQLMM